MTPAFATAALVGADAATLSLRAQNPSAVAARSNEDREPTNGGGDLTNLQAELTNEEAELPTEEAEVPNEEPERTNEEGELQNAEPRLKTEAEGPTPDYAEHTKQDANSTLVAGNHKNDYKVQRNCGRNPHSLTA